MASVVPAVNQLQYHAGMGGGADPNGLISEDARRGIVTPAYSPLAGDAHAALLGDATVKAIGLKHNRSTAQVALRWVLQHGHALATSTANPEYMAEDLEAAGTDWSLSAAELATLDALDVAPDDPVKAMCRLS